MQFAHFSLHSLREQSTVSSMVFCKAHEPQGQTLHPPFTTVKLWGNSWASVSIPHLQNEDNPSTSKLRLPSIMIKI